MSDEKLTEAKKFFDERVKGWMITDLKRSVSAGNNFLTALGCLTYTEVIGSFLPKVDGETGKTEERRFYRCLFRLPSADEFKSLDGIIRGETTKQQGLYQHLRHSATHAYAPRIKRRAQDGTISYTPVAVAKVAKMNGKIKGCPPMGIDAKGYFVIATKNYVNELEQAIDSFYERIFTDNEPEWVASAKTGIDFIARG